MLTKQERPQLFVDIRKSLPDTNNALNASHKNEHTAYLRRLMDDGILLMTGPLKDYGSLQYIFKAKSLEEATALYSNDPYIKYGVYKSNIIAWELHRCQPALLKLLL